MEKINDFLSIPGDGSGYGSGYGYGYGSGDGSGYGSGSGDGSGDGSGYGYGYGSGSGDGSGDGSGYGSGSGDGSGDGSGSGSGSGIGRLNNQSVYQIDGVSTIITHLHGNTAKGYILHGDFTKSPCYVVKNGNLFAHGETLREAQESLREKMFEDMDDDERIEAFLQEIKPNVKYPAQLFFDWHNKLTGSCLMGRKEFCKSKGIDVETDKLTLDEFINITISAYGGDIIAKVKEMIENENMA